MSQAEIKPGCFAAATVFSHDSDICRNCAAFAECSDATIQTLEEIRSIVDVGDFLKRHERAKRRTRDQIAAEDARRAAELPPGNIVPPLPETAERKTKVVPVTFELSPDEEQIIMSLPKKTRPPAISLIKKGVIDNIKKGIAENRNALEETGPGWLRVAVSLLLAGGYEKKTLGDTIASELNWTKGSADSHISIVCWILTSFGIAQERDGRFVLAPATSK